jgi:hypothetical protein
VGCGQPVCDELAPVKAETARTEYGKTPNFKSVLTNDAQVEAESEKLDMFWKQVRQSRATLTLCLRKALKDDKSGSSSMGGTGVRSARW